MQLTAAYIVVVKMKSPAVDVVTGFPLLTVMVKDVTAGRSLGRTSPVSADMVCVLVILVLLSMVTKTGATTVTLSYEPSSWVDSFQATR